MQTRCQCDYVDDAAYRRRYLAINWAMKMMEETQSTTNTRDRRGKRHCCSLPKFRFCGQCIFGLAIVFILAGIAFCIWGYLGVAIRPFQVSGPVCIGLGLLIYVVDCVLCWRGRQPDGGGGQNADEDSLRTTIALLAKPGTAERIRSEPQLHEYFQRVSETILLPDRSVFDVGCADFQLTNARLQACFLIVCNYILETQIRSL